jgi:uncharacterized lipoprotein
MKLMMYAGLAAAATLLAGCGAFQVSCNDSTTYAAAEDLPPLKVPTGLEAPDTRAALKIPALNEPERPRAAADECLENPPKYSTPRPEPRA